MALTVLVDHLLVLLRAVAGIVEGEIDDQLEVRVGRGRQRSVVHLAHVPVLDDPLPPRASPGYLVGDCGLRTRFDAQRLEEDVPQHLPASARGVGTARRLDDGADIDALQHHTYARITLPLDAQLADLSRPRPQSCLLYTSPSPRDRQ